MKKNRAIKIIFLGMFLLGLIVSIVFTSLTMWAGLEAIMFHSKKTEDQKLTSLRCPFFMSPKETPLITAVVSNPSEYDIQPNITFRVAHQIIIYVLEYHEQPMIGPGERYPISMEVNIGDAIYNGKLVLLSIYVTASYPQPSYWANCGIVVMDILGLSGAQLTWIMVGAGLMLLLSGYFLLRNALFPFTKRSHDAINGMGLLMLLVCVGVLGGIFRVWLLSLLLLTVSVILLVVLSMRYFMIDL